MKREMKERMEIINDTVFIKNHHGTEWNINRLGDDVLIECWDDDVNGTTVLALNQDELKTLIAFLQRQVK